jgi:signal transduction histidine kinase
LLAALRSLAAQVQKMCGIPLDLNLDDHVRVENHNAAVHLYRISQEAITNAARHSHASRIWLSLQDIDRDITVTVSDDGVGIPPDLSEKKGLGLRLMLYRARMIGATLSIHGRPEGGTLIRCVYRNNVNSGITNDGVPVSNER